MGSRALVHRFRGSNHINIIYLFLRSALLRASRRTATGEIVLVPILRDAVLRTAPRSVGSIDPLRLLLGLDRAAGAAPGAEATADMGDRPQPHALRGLRRERRARAGGAEEHELGVRRERRLVIFAGGIEPEFQHAPRTMEGA